MQQFGGQYEVFHTQNNLSFASIDTEKLEQPYFGGFQLNWNPAFSEIVRNAPEIPSKIPSQESLETF